MKKTLLSLLLAAGAAAGLRAADPLPVTLTFDDGLKAHLTEVAPILEKYGWHGTFNVIIDRVGKNKSLTWDDVRELKKRGHEIGNHSWSHVRLAKLGSNLISLHHEILDAQKRFKEELGEEPKFFCHPFTQTSPDAEKVIKQAGLRSFTLRRYCMMSKSKPGSWNSAKENIERELGKKGKAMPMDILFHGVSPTSGGWEAMTGADDFAGMMEEVAELEKAGKIKIVSYGEYLDAFLAKEAALKQAAAVDAKKVRIACIGDSITLGHMISDPAVNGYPAQLGRLLQAKYPDGYAVRNFGNGGRGVFHDTIRNLKTKEKRGYRFVPQYKQALQWKPHIVICNLGANDVADYALKKEMGASEQFRTDYKELLEEFRKVNPKVKFFIWTKLAPLAKNHRNFGKPEIAQIENDLAVIAEGLGAVAIDMNTPLFGHEKELLFHDGIHPKASGAKVIAEKTFEVLVPTLK